MLTLRPSRFFDVFLVGALSISLTACAANQRSESTVDTAGDASRISDTLGAFGNVRGVSVDSAGHVTAAIDALHGNVALPAPLRVKDYRREDSSVVIDLAADSLPRLKWMGAGGTVRILSDGRRAILARHN
jgi:hypothetical protein